jgi:SAM-dependent methyltransferase
MSDSPPCRSCGSTELHTFLSLGKTPLSDNILTAEQLASPEPRFPLDVAYCPDCTLVQILEEVPEEQLFVDNYLYFSSFSDHLLEHSRAHALELVETRGLDEGSLVVEIASNDGYLLKNFAERGIRVFGVDPAPDQARAAREIGVPTLEEFFGTEMGHRIRAEHGPADVVIAKNVMAHVPALNDFVGGLAALVSDDGVVVVENPYVRDLVEHGEFDTIYHEHFYYYSCTAVDTLMRRHGLSLNHIEYFPDLHGGTLRWQMGKKVDVSPVVTDYLTRERETGMTTFDYYRDFAATVERIKTELLWLLQRLKGDGARIAAYGAAAKGSTLINYVGIGPELIDFVVDRNTYKQGKFMPGMHVPIKPPETLLEEQPDYCLLLAWNFTAEILRQQDEYVRRGGRFIRPVPTPEILG